MGIELLITVALTSGGSVGAVYMMIFGLERNIDKRLDGIEMAIARIEADVVLGDQRVERLEDHENNQARNLRQALRQLQDWIDVVASPVQIRKDQ